MFKIYKTQNGTKLEIGNITTFLDKSERRELVAALLLQDDDLENELCAILEGKYDFIKSQDMIERSLKGVSKSPYWPSITLMVRDVLSYLKDVKGIYTR